MTARTSALAAVARPLLLERLLDAGGDVRPARPRVRLITVLNAMVVSVLLATALMWVWLRPSIREVTRAFVCRGRVQGSRIRYLWQAACRISEAMPWLVVGVGAVGVLLGVSFGGMRWWWLGLAAAFLGASLAPAWAETLVGHKRRS